MADFAQMFRVHPAAGHHDTLLFICVYDAGIGLCTRPGRSVAGSKIAEAMLFMMGSHALIHGSLWDGVSEPGRAYFGVRKL